MSADRDRAELLAAAAARAVTRGEGTSAEDEERMRRRRFLQAGIGVGIALTVGGVSILSVTAGLHPIAQVTPESEPPAEGDRLVFADDQSRVLAPADLELAAAGKMVYPMDPKTRVVKNGVANNLALVARFKAEDLSALTRQHAAGGVVAYSAVCTHLGCTVSLWDAAHDWFHCPCHHAQFDPRDDGKVMAGPAPRPLPVLPLKLDGDAVVVAGGFLTPVGPQ